MLKKYYNVKHSLCMCLRLNVFLSSILFSPYFLLLFKYSCLHFPPTTLPNPSHPHFPPLILSPFGFAHVSSILILFLGLYERRPLLIIPDIGYLFKATFHQLSAVPRMHYLVRLWLQKHHS